MEKKQTLSPFLGLLYRNKTSNSCSFPRPCVLKRSVLSLVFKYIKNVWCVARHVENLDKKIFKKLTLAKILCWTFRQLLLPSSAKDKK